MALPLVPIAIGSLAAGALGGLLKHKAGSRRADEEYAAGKREWDIREQQRIAKLQSVKAALKQRGLTDPFPDSALVPRPYPGPKNVGRGWDFAGSAASGLGDIGKAYVASQQPSGGMFSRLMSRPNPVGSLGPVPQPVRFNPFPGGNFPQNWYQP